MTLYFSVILNEFICYVLVLVVVVVVGTVVRDRCTQCSGFTCCCQCHRICVYTILQMRLVTLPSSFSSLTFICLVKCFLFTSSSPHHFASLSLSIYSLIPGFFWERKKENATIPSLFSRVRVHNAY